MLAVSVLRERLIEEISQIPDTKLAELFNFIHYFRVGLQASQPMDELSTPVEQQDALLEQLKLLICKPNLAPVGVFSLDMSQYHFDREEANER